MVLQFTRKLNIIGNILFIIFGHDLHFFTFNLPKGPSNLNFWIVSVSLKILTQFQPKIRATTGKFYGGSNLILNSFEVCIGRTFGKIKKVFPRIEMFLLIRAANRDIKSKTKFWRQKISYFETFLCLTKFSFHYKCKEA